MRMLPGQGVATGDGEGEAAATKHRNVDDVVAHVAGRLEGGEAFPTIAADVVDDARKLLLGALREMKEVAIAKTFEKASRVDPDDESEDWSNLGPPQSELVRLNKKLFLLVTTMGGPFPAP
jgi:hypothetical protein